MQIQIMFLLFSHRNNFFLFLRQLNLPSRKIKSQSSFVQLFSLLNIITGWILPLMSCSQEAGAHKIDCASGLIHVSKLKIKKEQDYFYIPQEKLQTAYEVDFLEKVNVPRY